MRHAWIVELGNLPVHDLNSRILTGLGNTESYPYLLNRTPPPNGLIWMPLGEWEESMLTFRDGGAEMFKLRQKVVSPCIDTIDGLPVTSASSVIIATMLLSPYALKTSQSMIGWSLGPCHTVEAIHYAAQP